MRGYPAYWAAALTLIEHEGNWSTGTSDRRIFVAIGDGVIRTVR